MRIVLEARACTILRNLFCSERQTGVVLLPANICPVVPLTLLTVQQPFEFVDIHPQDFCMDTGAVEARLRQPDSDVSGIIYVRTYGHQIDASAAFRTWKQSDPNLLIVDDRCLCQPEIEGVDSQGADAVLFSTGYGKHVDLGAGGLAYLADHVAYQRSGARFIPADAQRVADFYKRHIAQQTRITESTHTLTREVMPFVHWIPSEPLGTTLPDYLRSIRERLTAVTEHKAALNDIYRLATPQSAQLGDAYCTWRFQLRVPRKSTLIKSIFDSNHFASDHYYPASRMFGHQRCPNADSLYESVVNLFNDFSTTPRLATNIAGIVRRHLAHPTPATADAH